MVEAVSTSETSVSTYQTTRCYNPEDSYLQPPHLSVRSPDLLSLVLYQGFLAFSGPGATITFFLLTRRLQYYN
jgi:hypothetical protein